MHAARSGAGQTPRVMIRGAGGSRAGQTPCLQAGWLLPELAPQRLREGGRHLPQHNRGIILGGHSAPHLPGQGEQLPLGYVAMWVCVQEVLAALAILPDKRQRAGTQRVQAQLVQEDAAVAHKGALPRVG